MTCINYLFINTLLICIYHTDKSGGLPEITKKWMKSAKFGPMAGLSPHKSVNAVKICLPIS